MFIFVIYIIHTRICATWATWNRARFPNQIINSLSSAQAASNQIFALWKTLLANSAGGPQCTYIPEGPGGPRAGWGRPLVRMDFFWIGPALIAGNKWCGPLIWMNSSGARGRHYQPSPAHWLQTEVMQSGRWDYHQPTPGPTTPTATGPRGHALCNTERGYKCYYTHLFGGDFYGEGEDY